jgi:hypothetical protein
MTRLFVPDLILSRPLGSDKEKDATIFNTPVRNDSDPATESFHADQKGHHTVDINGGDEVDSFIRDPFHPFDDLPPEKHWVMTIRAVFVGLCCGCLVNASNVYLGLKTGWTFSANLFGVSTSVSYQRLNTKRVRLSLVLRFSSSFRPRSRRTFPSLEAALDLKRTTLFRQLLWLRAVFLMFSSPHTQLYISSSCLIPLRTIFGGSFP